MIRTRVLPFILALAILLPLWSRPVLAQAGTVVALSGECFVETQGRRAPLRLRDSVNVSDTVDVPTGGKLRLRMSDGSVLSFAPGTRMTIAAYQTDASGQRQAAGLSLSQGLMHAVVAPVERPASFEVSTAVGVAAVRSTDWFIEAQPRDAQVGVLSGSVSLTSNQTGRIVTIPAGWGARLEGGLDPVPARVWSPAEFQAVIDRTNVN